MSVNVMRSVLDLRRCVAGWRGAGNTLALVPTMGALHEGHLALVRLAKERCTKAVVSIFVNPRQFAPHEDFDRYPRDEAGDLAKLAGAGCDLVWSPDASEMYPEGFATRIEPLGAAVGLETQFRPHFFGGVTTVVAKLFNQVQPDIAAFGEKDYQQLCVIRQMVRDLDMPLQIVGLPTIREADGLALSSRNAYLLPGERAIAPLLHSVISKVAEKVAAGSDAALACNAAEAELIYAGFAKVDYIEVRDAETLSAPLRGRPDRPLRVLAAAWLGRTRLIDNVAV